MVPGAVPSLRIRPVSLAPVRAEGTFVLYWMVAHRRVGWNFALDRALEWVASEGVTVEPIEMGVVEG